MCINTYIDLLLYFTTVEMLDNGTEVLNINIVFYGAVSRTIKQPMTSTWLLSIVLLVIGDTYLSS